MPFIKLQSKDKKLFKIDMKAAKQSTILKTMMEDLSTEEGEVVPLDKVDAKIVEKIIEFAEHERDNPHPDLDDDERVTLTQWDQEFLEVNSILFHNTP